MLCFSSQDAPSGHRSNGQIVLLANQIFNRLLQVDDLTSDEDLAKLANDIVSYLPSPLQGNHKLACHTVQFHTCCPLLPAHVLH